MSVTDEYIAYITGQLAVSGEVVVRKMFGGAGLYLAGRIFAIIDDDTLYFKARDHNRNDYIAQGWNRFDRLEWTVLPCRTIGFRKR